MASRLRADMADNQPLILDGGLATELEAQGIHLQVQPTAPFINTDLWPPSQLWFHI